MRIFKKISDLIYTIVIAFIITLLISTFLFQPFRIEGHSMDPTLRDQERIYILKIQHTLSVLPNYGDIVIIDSRVNRDRSLKDDFLEFPIFQILLRENKPIYYVKRVIGKPGDVIELNGSTLYRNNIALTEPYIKETMDYSEGEQWVVPENHLFVMGDNRNNSLDSRIIGAVPLDHFLGKMVY